MSITPDTPPAFLAARQLLDSGKLREAERLLRQALGSYKGHHGLQHLLACCLLAQDKAQEALPWCEESVASAPDNAAYCKTLGDAYWQLQQPQKAIGVWHTSLYAYPLQEDVMLLLAAAYRTVGDIYAALDYYRQALEVVPSNGRARYDFARCFNEAGLLEDASREYQQALKHLPFHLPLLRDYAENCLIMAQYSLCETLLQTARCYYPTAACLWHLQGLLCFRTDRFDEAVDSYEQAVQAEPDNRDMLLDYAVCLRTMGDDRSAEKVLEKVRALSER